MIDFKPSGQGYDVLIGSVQLGVMYSDVSGYYVYHPDWHRQGFVEAWILHAIANKLDELNSEWDAQVQRDLSK